MKEFLCLLLPAVLVLAATPVLAGGGEPRTTGYWQACNGCTEGHWPERAAASGGLEAGWYAAYWDGHDYSGRPVGSGLYFYTLQAEGFNSSKSMILLR